MIAYIYIDGVEHRVFYIPNFNLPTTQKIYNVLGDSCKFANKKYNIAMTHEPPLNQ